MFRELGARIVAISVDGVEANRKLSERLKLTFPLLSDPERKVVQAFGVEEKKMGEGYPPGIANPAVFIIDSKGSVRVKHSTSDFADRPPNSTLIGFLRSL